MDRNLVALYARKKHIHCHDCDTVSSFSCHTKPTKQAITASQAVVHAIASAHANGRFDTRAKGLLVWHGTGSGKTCASTAVMDAFWDTDYDIFFVTSPANLNSNPPGNFHECAKMFPRFQNRSSADVGTMFRKRNVQFMSYAQIAHALALHRPRKNLIRSTRKVVIVDEAHVLVRPLQTQKQEAQALTAHLRHDSQCKLFLLTATPGENVDELIRMLNMTLPAHTPDLILPDNEESALNFMRRIMYSVSYYDPRNDMNIYPSVTHRNVMVPISLVQFSRYREAVNTTQSASKDYAALSDQHRLNVYYSSARRFANALFKMKDGMSWSDFSSKVMALIGRITQHGNQKHLVYSAFHENRGINSQGLFLVAQLLELLGFERVDVESMSKLDRSILQHPHSFLLKKKRYIVITTGTLGKNPARRPDRLTGLLELFNSFENRHGAYVQALLVSQNYYESLDLKSVRHVHIFDPLLTAYAFNQLVGRAARRCSHSQLSRKDNEWNVTVHRYSIAPPLLNTLKERMNELQTEINELHDARDDTVMSHLQTLRQQLKKIAEAVSEHDAEVLLIEEFIQAVVNSSNLELQAVTKLVMMAALDCSAFRELHGTPMCLWCKKHVAN
jgi:hypothetical protein